MSPDLHRTLTYLIRACDVVFGSTSMAIAIFALVELFLGDAHLGIVIALWAVPVCNIAWSLFTKRISRVRSDLIRGIAGLPLTAYIYVAESSGVLRQMWLPGLMICVGACMSFAVGTRRKHFGIGLSVAYGIGMLAATLIATGTIHVTYVADAIGVTITGIIISVVSAYLGATLNQLSSAVEEARREMRLRMQVEAELSQAHKLESVGRLAAGIAHEINTPVQFVNDSLHFVRGAVDDLFALVGRQVDAANAEAADVPYLSEEVPKALARAEDGMDRVSTIVRSMNQFAHPDADEMQEIDLNQSISATLVVATNEYKYVADLETDLGSLPPVRCYAGALNQVVLNIVVNAAHAIADVVGTSRTRGKIFVTTRATATTAVIAVSDTGSGIPDEIRDRIFEPFFTTKGIGRGTGQGLALAHSVIVDKHRGRLELTTQVGRGTTFLIEIPLAGHTTLALAA